MLLATLGADAMLWKRRAYYRAETARLRAGMTDMERQRTDAIVAADAEKYAVMLELMRRQADGDEAMHISVNTDSSWMVLERNGTELRRFPVRIGHARRVGVPPDTLQVSVPIGARSIVRLLTSRDRYVLSEWLWADRGLPIPAQRDSVGWTGPHAIVTNGGTLIYALPDSGPLADSSYVPPGAVRASAADLAAIQASLRAGMKVYFF